MFSARKLMQTKAVDLQRNIQPECWAQPARSKFEECIRELGERMPGVGCMEKEREGLTTAIWSIGLSTVSRVGVVALTRSNPP